MTSIKSIFGNFNNIKASEEEKILIDFCNEYIDHHVSFLEILIYEDLIYKKNSRSINSRNLIHQAMLLSLLYEEMIPTLIADYKYLYGETAFIKKCESVIFNKVFTYCDNNLKKYTHLIDEKVCKKAFKECI